MKNIIEHNKCVGCKACSSVCPTDAIYFKTDSEGFWYPYINSEKCIDCKKCQKVCPSNKEIENLSEEKEVYQAWLKDDNIRLVSTSGGIFYALAKWVVLNGGYVAGVKYSKDYRHAYHSIIHTLNEIGELIGSKYFQSDLKKDIFNRIWELLENDELVLFCGTPCQVAALKNVLNKDYENLITMDFICYGINSPKAFGAFLDNREKEANSKVKKVHLKNKINGWQSLSTYIEFENGTRYLKDKSSDLWVRGYIKDNLYMRDSCFLCKYRNRNQSDITVGDFWGIRRVSLENLRKGISVVICNTKKGKEILGEIGNDLVIKESSFCEVIKGNPSLLYHPPKSEKRNVFFRLVDLLGFDKTVLLCQKSQKIANTTIKDVLSSMMVEQVKMPAKKIINIINRMKKEFPIEKIKSQYEIEELDLTQFIKLNYFSENIIRDDNVFIVPFKNAVVDMHETSRLIIKRHNIEVGMYKLHGSKEETHIRLRKKAVWKSENGATLFGNTVIDLCEGGIFDTKYFSANGGCVVICAKKIHFGNDVMLGRNILIYDSDHHQILDKEGKIQNKGKEVIIEDKVWLTSNITVLKGAHIGRDSIIASYTTVTGHIEQGSMVVGGSKANVLHRNARWDRKGVR